MRSLGVPVYIIYHNRYVEPTILKEVYMGKAVRKNAKWHLIDDPEDLQMDEGVPRRQRALRARRCHICGEVIIAGEEHLARWYRTDKFYPMRQNVCCICGLTEIREELNKAIKVAAFLEDQASAVFKYIKDKNLGLKHMVNKCL
jgi:hypothetical protein